MWAFARTQKRYWLIPMLLVLALMGALAVFGESSVGIPLIYTLF